MSFNKEQQQAINASTKEDILISAGAGSGKTKTLSVRVNRIINDLEISPSELLVLTFTNNAAHEMKERIVASFKNDNNDFANQILSSHVQTFDSFAQYLVSQYAAKLGISDKISIVVKEVLESKTRQLLDEILDEYYNNPDEFDRLKETIAKLSNQNDEPLKKIVCSLLNSLQGITITRKKEILNNYDNLFFTKEFFIESTEEVIKEEKNKVKKAFIQAYLIDKNYKLLMESDDPSYQAKIFDKELLGRIEFSNLAFHDDNTQKYYEYFKDLESISPFEFIKAVKELNASPSPSKPKKGVDEDDIYLYNNVFKPVLDLFAGKKAILYSLVSFEDEENEYNRYISFKDDAHLIIDIVKELDKRVEEYKKVTNTFTFQDIQNMALALVTEEEYAGIAKEIRNRFKYIMVDEYQDTNDFQETFINALIKEDENGNRAHLFCVGDAKQAIYGFRGSNSTLFKNRQKEYESGEGHRVINMNKNYRSAKALLKDINYIFSYYMTYAHGGIDYLSPLEQLDYDDEVDLYGKAPYDHFGIYRLIPSFMGTNNKYQKRLKRFSPQECEIYAIINDIKEKVESGFLIYDRGCKTHTRPVQYRDFVILTRTKTPFGKYQKLFNRFNIPLNNKVSSNLYEVDAIILLQSLITLLSHRYLNEDIDVKHIFASIARSYVFEYDDDKIHSILIKDDLTDIYEDEIVKKMDRLIDRCKDEPFINIFTLLLEEFDVINKLYLIGDVEDNISKIESFYSIILNEQRAGEGLKEFLTLLKNVNKYDLDLESESTVSIENAVSLMTMHASKGLENKIVYMPVTLNKISTGANFDKPDYYFSSEGGIQLPYYHLDLKKTFINKEGEEEVYPSPIATLPYLRLAKRETIDAERDEHTRLFYVALTRAENCLYIVGQPEVDNRLENLYCMLSYCPHYRMVNEELIRKAKKVIPELQGLYNEFLSLIKMKENNNLPFTYEDINDKDKYLLFADVYKELISDKIDKKIDEAIKNIELALINYWHDYFIKNQTNLDLFISFYASTYDLDDVKTMRDWINFCRTYNEDLLMDDSNQLPVDEEHWNEVARSMGEALIKGDLAYFYFKKNDKEDPIYTLYHNFLINLLSFFFDVSYLDQLSFANGDKYIDRVEHCRIDDVLKEETMSVGNEEKVYLLVNNDEIEFTPRIHRRASHMDTLHDEDISDVLAFGTRMHRYMELVDFNSKDTSFIKDNYAKKRIDKVLSLPIFNDLSNTTVYKEYGYYDDLLDTTGFIDLLLKKDDQFIIVDYKLKNISMETYIDQLNTYRRNVASIFKAKEKNIKVMLVSLLTGDVEVEQ